MLPPHRLIDSVYKKLLKKLEFISYAPNGFEDPFVGHALKLFAQTLDVNVNGAAVAEVIKAPNLVKKLIAREYAVVVGGKEVEELELLGGNVNRFAVELELVFEQADLDVIELDNLFVVLMIVCAVTA